MSIKNWMVDDFFDTLLSWKNEMLALRAILLETNLIEERKWGQPCYTYKNKNIVILGHFKQCVTVSFFKGILLKDPYHILSSPGENSRSVRMLKFTTVDEIMTCKSIILEYIDEVKMIEDQGLKIESPKQKNPNDYPDELKDYFRKLPSFEEAFSRLTPGRKRAYLMFFNGAKQSQTRINRISKYIDKIIDGKGLNE